MNDRKEKYTVVLGVVDRPTISGRIYPEELMKREIERINKQGGILGQIGFPEDGKTNLKDASHKVKDIRIDDDGNIVGEVEVLNNEKGAALISAIKAGMVCFRSMGYGSVSSRDGVDVVEDFRLDSFDAVAKGLFED